MGKYNVGIREVHVNIVEVELTPAEDTLGPAAKARLLKARAEDSRTGGDDMLIEYSHDLDKGLWSTEKIE